MVKRKTAATVSRKNIANVLASRYASVAMADLWSTDSKILFERELWIAVMKAQAMLGLRIPEKAIRAYENKKNSIDVAAIRQREEKTKHDVKAKIDEFNALAGYEYIHLGMTSRDLTDNVEQLQIRKGMEMIRDKVVASLVSLRNLAVQYESLLIAGRTHNVVAQPILLGKRYTNFGEELLVALQQLEFLIDHYPLRGIKGAVGTQTDQLQLFQDSKKIAALEQAVANHLGFKHVLGSTGQIYPRSLDFSVIATLFQLSAAPANVCFMLRLMAGQDQMAEGFGSGQSGSSAMPHKVNARSSERIHALTQVLRGHVSMSAGIVGNQWYEGDVSDSVTRRVFLPDAFFAIDGIFETFLTVLDENTVYPAVVQKELEKYWPFLTSTRILMAAVQKGVGRETAHSVIKEHALAVAKRMKTEALQENVLFDLLAQDKRLGLSKEEILAATRAEPKTFTGTASSQIGRFSKKVDSLIKKYPTAALYKQGAIL